MRPLSAINDSKHPSRLLWQLRIGFIFAHSLGLTLLRGVPETHVNARLSRHKSDEVIFGHRRYYSTAPPILSCGATTNSCYVVNIGGYGVHRSLDSAQSASEL